MQTRNVAEQPTSLYTDVFDGKNEFKGQIGIIGILKKNLWKKGFFLFFSTKNWEIVQVRLDKFFVPTSFVMIHLFSLKLQV
jgi:hypothetical protein